MEKLTLENLQIYGIKIIIVFLLMPPCAFSFAKNKNNKLIFGKWILSNNKKLQVNYPILYFNTDSTAIFCSRGDTIYRFKYKIYKKCLILIDINGIETRCPIKEISCQNLVFFNLLKHKTIQYYRRSLNDVNNR
jgi:hypothetical protein